jgi:hypothetical protein
MLKAPIILFCSERSGSNLITKIFDVHPDISAPGASHLFKVMSECACKYPVGSDALRKAVLALFNAKVSRWRLDARPQDEISRLLGKLDRADEMVAALYAAEARLAGKSEAFIKENSAFVYLHFLLSQCSEPRILFMVRDPRDMALSWLRGPVMRGGVVRATDRWVYDQMGYLVALTHLPNGTPVSFLRYEDLLAAPEETMQRVCSELKLAYVPEMMSFHSNSSSAKEDAKRSSMWSNLDKPLISENAQKFRLGLDDDEIAYIEATTAPVMATLGYQSARLGKPPLGRFDTLEALRAHLACREPHEKPAYQALPAEERDRFETWSRLYARMSDLSALAPDKLAEAQG